MENSNQPAFSLQDVSKLSAKRKQGEKEKPDCILVGAEAWVEAEEQEVMLCGAAPSQVHTACWCTGKRDVQPLGM